MRDLVKTEANIEQASLLQEPWSRLSLGNRHNPLHRYYVDCLCIHRTRMVYSEPLEYRELRTRDARSEVDSKVQAIYCLGERNT